MNPRFGCQSMVEPLRTVLVRRPGASYGEADPERWHYAARPDLMAALEEHQQLIEALDRSGARVVEHDRPLNDHADAVFVHDPAIVTDRGAVILRMGKEVRRGEEAAVADRLVELGVPILGRLRAPATAEGGDLMWLGHDTLAVGEGGRTNAEGHRQLKEILGPLGVETVPVPLPTASDLDACLHLMTLISMIDHDLAVAFRPLLPDSFLSILRDRGIELIEVPPSELASLGPNVLALAPRRCLMVEGNPATADRLRQAHCTVDTYPGRELGFKAEGGPTCLTRPIWRAD